MKKNLITMLILVLVTISSLTIGYAGLKPGVYDIYTGKRTDSLTVQPDSLTVYAAEAESLTVIDGVLIECADQANWPHNDGVTKEK